MSLVAHRNEIVMNEEVRKVYGVVCTVGASHLILPELHPYHGKRTQSYAIDGLNLYLNFCSMETFLFLYGVESHNLNT